MKQACLEEVLMEHLRPVRAPASLPLPRAQAAGAEPRGLPSGFVWKAALAMLVVVAGVEATLHTRTVAGGLEYPCESASQLQAWMKNAGVDVPLPASLPSSVKLLGANRVQGGAVEVVYRVEGLTQKLRVSNVIPSGTEHHFQQAAGNRRAWVMGSHLYQVETGDASLACKLCHSGV